MLVSNWHVPDPESASAQSARSWRALRMMRSRPPGLARRGNPEGDRRADVFCAALEQSEQLASAAANSSNAVKPLLAFYALSQSVRALAAAKVAEHWQIAGHGMGAPNAALRSHVLADVTLTPHLRGINTSFGLLQGILGCGPFKEAVDLGAIWVALPPLAHLPLPGPVRLPALKASFSTAGRIQADGSDAGYVALHGLPGALLPAWPYDQKQVDEYLFSQYPSLKGTRRGGESSEIAAYGADERLRSWSWVSPPGAVGTSTFSDEYGPWAIPRVGGVNDVTHPLVLWWALLFALSNRARYEPQGWFADLDLDRNESAEVIDYTLKVSLGECPRLIHKVLTTDDAATTSR